MIDPLGFARPNQSSGNVQNQKNQLGPIHTDDLTQLFNEASKVIDNEIQMLMAELKKLNTLEPQRSGSNQVGKEATPEMSNLMEAYIASLMTDVELNRKTKKKSSFEERLELLAKLEEEIDTSQLPSALKEAFDRFFDNMSRIRRLKTRLKQLQKEEQQLADYLARNPKGRNKPN